MQHQNFASTCRTFSVPMYASQNANPKRPFHPPSTQTTTIAATTITTVPLNSAPVPRGFSLDQPILHQTQMLAQSTNQAIHRPSLHPAKFGSPHNWSLDIFSLPHNAIRQEATDLYNILESIHARSIPTLAQSDLRDFHIWWKVFEPFLVEYFDFEADVLFPFLFPKTIPPDPSQTTLHKTLHSLKDPLLESLRHISATFELRLHVDPADIFHTILHSVNSLLPALMHYFHLQEQHLPPLLARLHSPSTKPLLARKYLLYIRHGEAPTKNLPLLLRWMAGPTRLRWVRANIGPLSRLLYPRWERHCFREHLSIPALFHAKLVASVRNVAASRLRRRTEFGECIDDISFASVIAGDVEHSPSFRSLSLATSRNGSFAALRTGNETSKSFVCFR